MRDLISLEAQRLITEGIMLIRHLFLKDGGRNWDGSHGQDHWARVACMAEAIRLHTPDIDLQMQDVVIPALIHDLGRTGDSADAGHGVRGAKPAAKALFLLEEHGLAIFGLHAWGRSIDTVIHHCDSGSALGTSAIIVRDADMLDIYRDGKDRVNTDRLQTIAAIEFINQAKKFSRTKWEFDDGLDNT